MDGIQQIKDKKDIWILAVDDEPAVRKIVSRFLTQHGYNCITAGSCQEAKEILENRTVDLVLADLLMPNEDGLVLIKYVKENFTDTALVMLTGSSDPKIAREVMEIGVYGYIIKPVSSDMLIIAVENALRHHFLDLQMRVQSGLLEEKAWSRKEQLGAIMENLSVGVAMVSADMKKLEMNSQMRSWFPEVQKKEGLCFHTRLGGTVACGKDACPVKMAIKEGKSETNIKRFETSEGLRDFHVITSPVKNKTGEVFAVLEMYEDITERLISEQEASKRQKLEAVGQLASGIVHEINTPVQYVMDNINFLQDSFEDMTTLVAAYEELLESVINGSDPDPEVLQEAMDNVREDADLDYLLEELPKTLEQSLEGMQRLSRIVRAMKEFSHPGSDEKTLVDINDLLDNAVTISKNEWKYVADVKTNFAHDLPKVSCLVSEMNQVFLNLIVNAAHAISTATNQGNNGKGCITISSHGDDKHVRVHIQDTGHGIPEENRDKVFQSFFTTKGRGEGTGQGLAIARRVIEESHNGRLSFESTIGEGTEFIIELPLK